MAERKLLEIDPRTVEAGSVANYGHLINDSTAIAKGRDGETWYMFYGLASEIFKWDDLRSKTWRNRPSGEKYHDQVEKAFATRYRDLPNSQGEYKLGVAAKVAGNTNVQFNPYDIALWRIVPKGDSAQLYRNTRENIFGKAALVMSEVNVSEGQKPDKRIY